MPEDKPSFGTELKGAIDSKLDEFGLTQTDYVKAALKWQYNWIGLAGAAAFALVSGTGLPIVLAAGIEMMYVALVPQSSRFRRLVRSWKYAAEKQAHDARLNELYKELPADMRARYTGVQEVVQAIRANYAQLSSTSQIFAKQMEDKLSGLLQGYVRLLHTAHAHHKYVETLNPEYVTHGIEILDKIRENREVIDAQCAAIEDVLQLIRDQSVTMRDPQEVSAQLDHLVQDVEQTEQSVREVEAIFALASPEGIDDLQLPLSGEAPPARTKARN
jgi:hypothetical protein